MRRRAMRRRLPFLLASLLLLAACGHGHKSLTLPSAASTDTPFASVGASPSASATAKATASAAASAPVTGSSRPGSTAPHAIATTAATSDSWPTYHRDGRRSGYDSLLPRPSHLTSLFSKALDGAVYAE